MRLALAALFIIAGTSVFAQSCADRDLVVNRLAEKYGERRQSIGLSATGSVVEMFASPDTGSWTITVTSPDGVTCLAASGQSYEALADGAPIGEPT